jgi:hypothetical protein
VSTLSACVAPEADSPSSTAPAGTAAGPPTTLAGSPLPGAPRATGTATPGTGSVDIDEVLRRAVCWLGDASAAAECLPPSEAALQAIREAGASGDLRLVAPLIDMRTLEVGWAAEVDEALDALTGRRFATQAEAYSWLAEHPQPLGGGYASWKGRLIALVDPRYAGVLGGAAPTEGVRPELFAWSGLRIGELPGLDLPNVVHHEDAPYLVSEDVVFGLVTSDEARAYPRRLLSWHPLIEDSVGGQPVLVTYCGPCGAASAFLPMFGGRALTFLDAGLWYDGRPLLMDTQTGSLWDAFSGRAVWGSMAAAGAELPRRVLVSSTMGEWAGDHPGTGVLSDVTGHVRDYSREAAEARDRDLAARFPLAGSVDGRLGRDERVLGITIEGESRAYLVGELRERRIVHDTLGGERIVLLSQGPGRAVRVYLAGNLEVQEFRDDFVVFGGDSLEGNRWFVQEDAIVSQFDGRRHEAAVWVEANWLHWSRAYPGTSIFGR